MQLKSHFSLEVLELEKNKYLLCLIKVKERPITYYYKQVDPQTTYRWLQPHNWAEFDAILHELVNKNKLKHLSKNLEFHLKDSINLKLSNSAVPIDSLCQIITDVQINAKAVVNAIECSIEYNESHANSSHEIDPIYKLAVSPVPYVSSKSQELRNERAEGSQIFPKKDHKKTLQKSSKSKIQNETVPDDHRGGKTPQKLIEGKSSKVQNADKTSKQEVDNENETKKLKKLQEQINPSDNSLSPTAMVSREALKSSKKSPVKSPPTRHSPRLENRLLQDLNENKMSTAEKPARSPVRRETRKRRMLNYTNSDSPEQKLAKLNEERDQLFSATSYKSLFSSVSEANKEKTVQPENSAKKKVSNENCNHEKRSMNTWLSKNTSTSFKKSEARPQMNSPKKSGTKLEFKLQAEPSMKELRENKNEEEDEEHIKWVEAQTKYNREVTKIIKELVPKSPEKVDVLDLMDLSTDNILKSFKIYKNELDSIFRDNKSKLKINGIDGVDHFLVMELISSDAQLAVMDKLSEHYEGNDAEPHGPKYGKLFSMILMPEWIMKIFMKRYSMKREEAIAYIKAQNAYRLHKQNDTHLEDTLS